MKNTNTKRKLKTIFKKKPQKSRRLTMMLSLNLVFSIPQH